MASYKPVSPRIDTDSLRRASRSSHDSPLSGRRSSVSPIEPEESVQNVPHDSNVAERPQTYEPVASSDVVRDSNATNQAQVFDSAASRKSSNDSREKAGHAARVTTNRPRSCLRLLLQPSFLMSGLMLWGVLLAVGHHVVYQYLNGELVSSYSQDWIIRIATGVALLIKASWSLAVGVALQQTLWYTFRRQFVRIGSVDKLLTMEQNLLGFLSIDALKFAPTAMALAVVMWLLPVLTVITPGSLSVVVKNNHSTRSATCQVPTFANSSFQGGAQWVLENGDVEVFPSPQVEALTSDVLSGGGILPFASPCGVNCSYEISFAGPGVECENAPNSAISRSGVNVTFDNGTEISNDTTVSNYVVPRLSPDPNTEQPQTLNESAPNDPLNPSLTPGTPGFTNNFYLPYYSAILGTEREDRFTIWIQYLNNDTTHHVPNTFRYNPFANYGNGSGIEGTSPLTPAQENETWQTMFCTLHDTLYSVRLNFEDGDMSTATSKLSSSPLDTSKESQIFNDSMKSLEDQYMGLSGAFFQALGGHVFGWVPYIEGINASRNTGPVVYGTLIANTGIASVSTYEGSAPGEVQGFGYSSWIVAKPFLTAIPELFTNITLSALSISSTRADIICTSASTETVYEYEPFYLVLAYFLGLLATLLSIVVGIFALRANGSAASSSFSQIVRATANPALHHVLDNDRSQDSKGALEQRIMYGETVIGDDLLRNGSELEPSTQGKAAFGLEGQVIRLRRNRMDTA